MWIVYYFDNYVYVEFFTDNTNKDDEIRIELDFEW